MRRRNYIYVLACVIAILLICRSADIIIAGLQKIPVDDGAGSTGETALSEPEISAPAVKIETASESAHPASEGDSLSQAENSAVGYDSAATPNSEAVAPQEQNPATALPFDSPQTTTRYTDRLLQLHLTSPAQAEVGYKGGEGWQMVYCMDVSRSNPDILVMGTDTNGIWKSEDGGKTWRCSTGNFNATGVYAVAFDPDDANVIYALGGASVTVSPTGYVNPYMPGLYRSGDGGQSWEFIFYTPIYKRMNSTVITFGSDKGGGKAVYVGTQKDGLFKSTDGGSFKRLASLTGTGTIYDISVTGQQVIIATASRGIMVSEDGGERWNACNTGIPAKSGATHAMAVTVDPAKPSHWFCIAGGAIYRSTDSGMSWKKLATSDGLLSGQPGAAHYKLKFSAAAKAGETPHLYLSMNEIGFPLRVSDDYGESWAIPSFDKTLAYNSVNTGFYAEAFAVDKINSDKIWISLNNEIFRSENGGADFVPSSSGYSGANATEIFFDPENAQDIYVCAIDFGLSRSAPTDSGDIYPAFDYLSVREDLAAKYGKSAHGLARDPGDKDHVFTSVGGWYSSFLLESMDGGNSWRAAGGREILNRRSERMVLSYHKNDPLVIYAGTYRSDDNGVTWKKLALTITAVSPVNNDIVFATDTQDDVERLYISMNRGADWSRISARSDNEESYLFGGIRCVLPDSRDKSILWLTRADQPMIKIVLDYFSMKVTQVTAYGETQGFKANSAGDVRIFAIAQNPENPLHMIAGGADFTQKMLPSPGFFESSDGGESWRIVNGMEGVRDVKLIRFHPSLPQVWMGTSAGIWIYEYQTGNYSEAALK